MILFLTTADTEILTLRVAAELLPDGFPSVRAANPTRLDRSVDLDGVSAVLIRLLGGRRTWEDPFDALAEGCAERGVPLLAFGGEASPDAELAERSSVPGPLLAQAFRYLAEGGPENLASLLCFVADTVLMHGFGFAPPVVLPECGRYVPKPSLRRPSEDGASAAAPGPSAGQGGSLAGGASSAPAEVRPRVGVVFYRAHVVAGNTGFVDELCSALEEAGGDPVAVFGYSLRDETGSPDSPGRSLSRLLVDAEVDVVVTTMLAAGSLDEETETWDAGVLAELDVPILQAICSTQDARGWQNSESGLNPMDVAMAVAIPEFDGRIVSVPFSFKETVDIDDVLGSPVSAYRTQEDRVARVATMAVRLGRLGLVPPERKRVAVVLSAYPTKRSRLGNAVGLDTPESVLALLRALAGHGYRVDRIPASGDELMAELADTLTYDVPELTVGQVERAVGTWSGKAYRDWFATLPDDLRRRMTDTWGEPPGSVCATGSAADGALVFSGINLGGVIVAVQPPRGFGEDPIAVYHSPDLAPTHHYLAFYRWLELGWGADAVVHVGKHGTLEWLPGKSVGMSASCAPDAALGSLPLVYPFVVNDPGEGTQAKRRAHAVIVDHLVPPLTRAELTDDLTRIEQLLDAHAQIALLDPTKLPEIRRQVWEMLVAAEIHRDLGLAGDRSGTGEDHQRPPAFDDPAFDDVLLRVDGYLCELKDAQIRGGLHVLGAGPQGPALVDMVLAITRLPQLRAPSLRSEVARSLGLDDLDDPRTLDAVEEECRRQVEQVAGAGWDLDRLSGDARLHDSPVHRWVCSELVPALGSTGREIDAVLDALDGRFVPPGASGAPSRGMAHVLPTGRNFYSVDPKAIPSPLAWKVGVGLAERLVDRFVAEEGRPPVRVGLVVWGTAAMRTGGDDVAEVLALLGVRPRWAPESGRVEGLELIEVQELGRPRVDVTVRVSGFFRDAFPHVLALIDDAIALAAASRDGEVLNPVASSGIEDPRVFGPRPGAYGSGILALIESGNWRGDEDLAEVYLAWGGFAYRRDEPGGPVRGRPAVEALRRRLVTTEVAVKNQDNREHDIFDSDDYLQDHGGMVATIRALSGNAPRAWFGDSSDPSRPRVRSLGEEAARVVRSRVVNPTWLDGMKRHGYKGAFEMAATVDYLFGYDATAGVVEDWMYERVTAAYVADPAMRAFFEQSNPWALHSIAERLLEAAARGLWNASSSALGELRTALLEAEGWEEGR